MKRVFKIIGFTLGALLLMVILAIVFLLTPWGKSFLTEQVTAYLNNKLNTEVVIKKLEYTLPNSISIHDFAIQDLKKDTLLSIHMLRLDINMLALINSKIDVKGLYLDGVNAYMHRQQPDSFYNYQFIIDAFAGKKTDTLETEKLSDTSSNSLAIEIVKTHLSNINFRFNDEMGGTDFSIQLKELFLKPKIIDINKLQFDINELTIQGVKSTLLLKASLLPPTIDTNSSSSPLLLSAEKLSLKEINFTMENKVSPMYLNTYVGSLEGKVPLFDLIKQLINIDKVALDKSTIQIILGKVDQTKQPVIQEEDIANVIDTLGWRIFGDQVNLRDVNFKYDDNNAPKQVGGLDYAHMDVQHIVFLSDNLKYTNDSIAGNIKQLALKEQSGLVIQEMRTLFTYHNKGAVLDKFFLKTPKTILQDKLIVNYPSLAALSKDLNALQLDINLEKSIVGVDDILLFTPKSQQSILLPYKNQSLQLSAQLSGYLNNLQIKNLFLAGLNNTRIHINGMLKGLPDPEKLQYNFNIHELATNKKDLDPFIPAAVHEQINIPQQFKINGKLAGNIYAYQPDLLIKTSDGDAKVKGNIHIKPEGSERYDLLLTTHNLNLGKILKQDSLLGVVSTDIAVKGTSFDMNQMEAEFDLYLKQANILNYNYQQIKANGFIKNNFAMVKAISEDPNARFTLEGTADLSQKHPSVMAAIQMQHVDLFALNLSADTLSIAGLVDIDAPVLDPDYPVASLYASEMEVAIPGVKLPLDSIIIKANSSKENGQNIEGSIAQILNFGLTGNIPLTQIGNAAIAHINRHYHIADSFADAANYDMQLTANAIYNPILKRFDPNIKPFDSIKLLASLNPSTFDLNLNFPRIIYGDFLLNQGLFTVTENATAFNYALSLDKFKMGNTIALYSPTIGGNIQNNAINANVSIADSLRKEQFALGANIRQHDTRNENSDLIIKLAEGLKFNYDLWNVNSQNEIRINDAGINIANFQISQGDQSIKLQSESAIPNSPLDLAIQQFKLSNITSIISGDTLIADGTLNADGNIDLDPQGPFMYLKAKVNDVKIFETPFGSLDISAQNRSSQVYDANVILSGNGNNVNLVGRYDLAPADGNNLDFKLNLAPLSLASIDGLTFGNLKNSSGNLNGSLAIRGSVSKPQVLGEINTENLATKVSMLGVLFSLPKEKIAFTNNGIVLDNFKIYDEENSFLSLNGTIRSRDFTQYFLDLNIGANHWKPINSTQKDYDMLYGELYLTTDLKVRGLATAPKVTGNLQVHDDTKLSFALLDSDPQIVETDGVVKFVDKRYPLDEAEDTLNSALSRVRFSRSAEMNVNVAVDKKATFNLVIDPSTGDNLQVKGEAALNTQIAPNGSIGLVGTYLIDDGYYELSFPPVRRRFKINQGSTITLVGDPLDAQVNITAKYTNNVAPYDLMESTITDPEQLVYYKQRIPIDVILRLNGAAMKPDISFDIQIPEDKINVVSGDVGTNVKNRLAVLRTNASDINKQVFGVIVLGKFISEDPFNMNGGAEVEHIARQSVSRFLSTQLNTIAGQFITGLDLNMDLESSEDYTSGQKQNRTDLNISASKSLFQDRLSVTVGNDFLLEGAPTQNKQTSYIPGSLSADYKLSKDGRYQLRAYRKNELQNIIDGYVVETGVGFRMNLEYNRFRSVFMSPEKLRAYYRKQREKQEREKASKEKKELSLLLNSDLFWNSTKFWEEPYYYTN